MITPAQAVTLAGHLGKSKHLEFVVSEIFQQGRWQQEDGPAYYALDADLIRPLLVNDASSRLLELGPEVEIVRVDGTIPPHYHKLHDAVAVVRGVDSNLYFFMRREYHSSLNAQVWCSTLQTWRSTWEHQLLFIPRREVHGFRANPLAAPFYLLIVNTEPFTKGDTFYVDVDYS